VLRVIKHAIWVLAPLILWAGPTSAAIITFEGEGTNVDIPLDWNANNIGVSLTWSAEQEGDKWQFYNDAEWTAAQMDGFESGSIFDLLITPDAGYSVKVDSFVFDDYAGYKGGSSFSWELFEGDASGALITSGTSSTTNGEDLPINTGMTSSYEGSVLLRLIGGAGNDGHDEALSSITYTLAEAAPSSVPEPATLLLLGTGLLGLAGFRRFKR